MKKSTRTVIVGMLTGGMVRISRIFGPDMGILGRNGPHVSCIYGYSRLELDR
jgi:hypothetical protein